MARPVVTQELVDQCAAAIEAEGGEATTKTVQVRTGGSYTTVQRYLEDWRRRRAQALALASPAPPEVDAKALEFGRTLWALASQQANQAAQAVKDQALATVSQMEAALMDARGEIARLEGLEAEHVGALDRLGEQLRAVEGSLAAARVTAERVPGLEGELAQLRREREEARELAHAKEVEAARALGEAQALRDQVAQLTRQDKPEPPTKA